MEALRALASELSLGLDSFVFVDDSPVECAEIRQYLPEVAVVEVPVDRPWELVKMLADESFFDSATVTDDDVNRPKEYEAQAQRNALLSATTSRDEFLQSLGIVCTFLSAVHAPLARSVQLLAKTNQFNLTTRRHSSTEVERFAKAAGGQSVAVRVRDRFGDAGVVGLALAAQQGDRCVIDSLLLSCRVIGRGIETALLALVAERAAKTGSRWLIGEYIESKKNALCADFYPMHGFERDTSLGGANSIFYRLDLTEQMPTSPAWLTIEGDLTDEFAAGTIVAS
jgi:FkbH-like protein